MPAPIAYRRLDMSLPPSLIPDIMYAPPQRYAIIALGFVVGVAVLPVGVMPSLLSGQTALLSSTLKVGDRA